MKTYVHLWSYLAEYLLERETFQTKVLGKLNNIFYIQYFFPPTSPDNRAVYELMWKNMVEMDRPQITICNTAHALCMLGTLSYRHTCAFHGNSGFWNAPQY